MKRLILVLSAVSFLALGCQQTASDPADDKTPAAKTHVANKPVAEDSLRDPAAKSNETTITETPAATTEPADDREVAPPEVKSTDDN